MQEEMESRHFMSSEEQITITLPQLTWQSLQRLANENAKKENWLGGEGSDWDYLNIWICYQVHVCPKNTKIEEWLKNFTP